MIRNGNYDVYENGIEFILRKSNINYIATDETKCGLKPNGGKLKNFDAIINSSSTYLVDFKGKQCRYFKKKSGKWDDNVFENWIGKNAIESLLDWKSIFKKRGCDVTALLVYIYKIHLDKDYSLFKDRFTHKGIHYGVVAIKASDYKKHWKPRSGIKNAMNISRGKFSTLVKPLSDFIPEIKYN